MTNDIYIIIVCFTRVILLCHVGKGPVLTALVLTVIDVLVN